ncbi:MAG: M1 family metallopeptidase [Proteobacteria bacterium]|nr:M1 family metallopeptidase [Pseudomonadota bacterium]
MMRRDFALPGTPVRHAPDRVCDVRHIRLAIDIDIEARTIRGTCSLTLAPLSSDLSRITLNAVELDIHRVSCRGSELAFSHDGAVLRVDLHGAAGQLPVGPAPGLEMAFGGGSAVEAAGAVPSAGQGSGAVLDQSSDQIARPSALQVTSQATGQVTIDIEYSGSPRRGLYFVGPDEAYPDKPVQVWTQGQDEDSRYWFPCFDSPHEKATSEVIATVPGEFFALSNGALISDTTEGGRRTMHWRFDTPHSCYLITLAAGQFSEIREYWGDVEVTYYAAVGREDEMRRTVGKTTEMLELFSNLFGLPYPYEKYAQVSVADFIFGGMENTTATTLTDTVLLDERAALDYDAEKLVSHELAHQWFGDLLTCRHWGEGWLNEGFATYSEYLWREHSEGRDAADVELAFWDEKYFSEDSSRYRRKVATKIYDEPIDIFDHHLYEKGGRVLHMLRQLLGDQAFWASIAHYLNKHRTGSVETRDLARSIESATGRVLDWFFEQWITEGAGHPELEVAYAWDADRKLARFTVVQTQTLEHDTPIFRMPLKVRFRVGDVDRDLPIEVTEREQTFFFVLDEEPSQAIFDPGKTLLAKIKTDKGIHLIEAELKSATLACDRIHAANELAKRGGYRAAERLIAALGEDPFWAVRAAAARGLGELRTDRARDGLLRAVRETEHARARRAVVRALGLFRDDAAVQDVLADMVERGDPSYFVEAEAALSLGKTRSRRAPELLREAAGRDSFADVIRQYAYQGLAEARDDSAIGFLCDATAYGQVSQGRSAAIKALAELTRGRRDRDARDVRDVAERLLFDRDFRVQYAALEAVGKMADPAALAALDRLVERSLDGRLRRRAREIIRDIQEERAQGEAIAALRDDVDKLHRRNVELQQRLDALEAQLDKKKRTKKRARKNGKKT